MDAANIEQRVREVFSQTVSVSENVTLETRLESLGLDSLDMVEFVMELEEEFDITVEDSAAESWQTVGDIISYVEKSG